MEQLWAPWRLAYVQEAGAAEGCVFCREAAGELGEASLVVHRGERAFVLLNKFPYSSGHLMVAPVRHIPALGDLDEDESAEIHALTVQALAALQTAYGPEGFNVGWNLGHGRGRIDLRPPARARRAALGRRHELHARARRRQGAARASRGDARPADGALGDVIRELAENPNVHQPHVRRTRAGARPGRALRRLPREAAPGLTAPRCSACGSRPERSPPAVEEIRALLRDHGRGGSEWELGESSTPADLVEQLASSGSSPTRTSLSRSAWS